MIFMPEGNRPGECKMRNLDNEEMKTRIVNLLKDQRNIVLATCDQGKVTARTVYCASNGLKVYFLTSKAYRKYKQILKNPSVAMCFANVQIQGTAVILGHPLTEENQMILAECGPRDQEFTHWSKYKNTVLIEVDITEVECWNNNGREFLDVLKEKSYRVG